MAKGRKYDEATKEKARALLIANNVAFVARALKLPWSTVKTWQVEFEKEGVDGENSFVRLREKKKKEFVEDAWRIIGKGTRLLERRIDLASEDLDKFVDSVLSNANMSADERREAIRNIALLKIEDIGKLSTAIGTLYDKQALANKEPTTIVEADLKRFEDYD